MSTVHRKNPLSQTVPHNTDTRREKFSKKDTRPHNTINSEEQQIIIDIKTLQNGTFFYLQECNNIQLNMTEQTQKRHEKGITAQNVTQVFHFQIGSVT
jgi:hypothetical protein